MNQVVRTARLEGTNLEQNPAARIKRLLVEYDTLRGSCVSPTFSNFINGAKTFHHHTNASVLTLLAIAVSMGEGNATQELFKLAEANFARMTR